MSSNIIIKAPIRTIPIVIDLKDPITPPMTVDDFKRLLGKKPDPDRYRVITLEVVTSPEDQQPMLVSECWRYSSFIRRESEAIYFEKDN